MTCITGSIITVDHADLNRGINLGPIKSFSLDGPVEIKVRPALGSRGTRKGMSFLKIENHELSGTHPFGQPKDPCDDWIALKGGSSFINITGIHCSRVGPRSSTPLAFNVDLPMAMELEKDSTSKKCPLVIPKKSWMEKESTVFPQGDSPQHYPGHFPLASNRHQSAVTGHRRASSSKESKNSEHELILAVTGSPFRRHPTATKNSSLTRVSRVQTMLLLLILVSLFLSSQQAYSSASSSSLEPANFFFASFNGSCSGEELICMGSASTQDGYLKITPEPEELGNSTSNTTNKVGRVLYSRPVVAWPAMISTMFTVRITTLPNSTVSGDGMAFLFAQDKSASPPNSYGSYMGILDKSTQGGVVRQLAVEMDTYMNEFDPDGNHVGIDTTSTISPVATQSLNSTGVDLKSGRDIRVRIDYDGYKHKLQISVAYSGKSLISVLNHSIRMSETVPNLVYVGFSGSTGPLPESHQVINWAFSSFPISLEEERLKRDNRIKTILVLVVPSVMLLSFIVICICLLVRKAQRKRNKKNADMESQSRLAANVPKMFTYKELAKATHNFSKENLLGTGGFGSVYKGVISDPPVEIAVKKISATSKQGEREYLAEICTIGRMRHKNIVQLQGLACLHPNSASRPTMRKVVQIFLNPDEPLMELPKSRPSVVYVPVSFSGATTVAFSSRTRSTFSPSLRNSPHEIELEEQQGMLGLR
ncbi:hypothetical protein NL676_035265 [Syzygium grande]|nr:hypothetical protein NL676_035265 [Syzygium grande]